MMQSFPEEDVQEAWGILNGYLKMPDKELISDIESLTAMWEAYNRNVLSTLQDSVHRLQCLISGYLLGRNQNKVLFSKSAPQIQGALFLLLIDCIIGELLETAPENLPGGLKNLGDIDAESFIDLLAVEVKNAT